MPQGLSRVPAAAGPCPAPWWGNGQGPGSAPAAAHAVPVQERPAPLLGPFAPEETLLGAVPSAAPSAPGAGCAELPLTPPASGSQASPEPAAGAGPPLSPPVAVADQGPELFTTGSGGAAAGAKPVALTGQGSQAAGASSAVLWTLSSCQMTVQLSVSGIPCASKCFGPVDEGMSALLVACLNATAQGIIDHLGDVDSDFLGCISAMSSTLTPPVPIPAGPGFAHLVPFEFYVRRAETQLWGDGGFGFPGPPWVTGLLF
ncbi:skin secretory protein xP2-like [Cyanistes caeruleus]|uniref:skin secretory protein xP2-like n=1 Tax=Cyanistes caeruleus TaxID=156563 RepID=UPI000CDA53E8|nr:skin secretory protein xP2-like [Cyanistes caeruleus]